MKQEQGIVLTITGSDSIGESGVQADIRTISDLGGRALSAITSVTMQNTIGILEYFDLPATTVAGQIEAVLNDILPVVIKIGMIRKVEVLHAICEAVRKYNPQQVIYHPVVYSARGEKLMDEKLAHSISKELLPLCSLIIMKKRDAQILMEDDTLYNRVELLEDGQSSHGENNCFSAAVAVFLSQGMALQEALDKSKEYIRQLALQTENLHGRSEELFHDFLELLSKDYAHRSDVQYYADGLNVSSRYLAQVVRRVSGKSPKSIIDERVLKEIKQQLASTPSSIQEVAYLLGFSSQAHLSRFFRKMTGQTPREYRNSLLKK
jgi:hydroxymethylpyrimidine/phosphomethylpyrimidine kinase